jgi:2-octaprenyl-6-methoxyphenol hydroxylase
VGCVAALALRDSHSVRLLDSATSTPAFRPIVLSYASRLILERVGAWSALAVTPIDTIRVSQHGAFGRTTLGAVDAGVPALGYVVEYAELISVLRGRAADLLTTEESPAHCVVHAEGASPDAIVKRYAQDALVALLEVSPAARTIAYERFTPDGPLALLPFAGRYAVVWSLPPEKARLLAAAPEPDFLRQLTEAAGSKPGRAIAVEARAVQSLALRVRQARIGERAVPRRRCIRWPGKDSTWGCAMPGTWHRSCGMRRIRATRRRCSASRRGGDSMPARRSAPPTCSPGFSSAPIRSPPPCAARR